MNQGDLRQIDELLQKRLKGFATKDDLQQFPTKQDLNNELKRFATKDDLKSLATKKDLGSFATKDDLKQFPTKQDLNNELKRFATKDGLKEIKNDIAELRQEFKRDIDEAVIQIIEVVNDAKADKSEVEALDKRVSRLEEHVAS